MKAARFIGLLGVVLATSVLAATAHGTSAPNAARCGGNLWRLKTLSDPASKLVRLTPKTTTIGAIRDRIAPQSVPAKRTTGFQKQTWEVVAQVVAFRREAGGFRLVLFDNGAYLNAAIPAPSCLPRSARDRKSLVAAWTTFGAACGRASGDWQSLGAIAYVRGVGFWSERRANARGAAANGAELHPVTSFRPVAGCGS
ncbi:MAG: hypothetical protein WAQ33_12565 [Gaiellaceae bacterium]